MRCSRIAEERGGKEGKAGKWKGHNDKEEKRQCMEKLYKLGSIVRGIE